MASQPRADWEIDKQAQGGPRFRLVHLQEAATRPPAAGTTEDRVRAVFAKRAGTRLPRVNRENLATYYRYLARQLSFPFDARYCEEVGPFELVDHVVRVSSLVDPRKCAIDTRTGLLCTVRMEGREREAPLADLELEESSENQRLIEDYWYWFWNWRC